MREHKDSRSTYSPENHESFQARSEDHEDRWWKVAYDPNNDCSVLCHRDGGHGHIDSFDNISFEIRE